ncbi:hypothetical protein [Trinickia mobilis]|uniref:hypothetical protein n=1 Tax=Trinickia mobilis TaxID=2816356 RepID=UPI0035ABBF05
MESLIQTPRRPASAFAITLFALIAIVGLYYVKCSPYYHRAFVAAGTHSIGHSIPTGMDPVPPQASWHAALHF